MGWTCRKNGRGMIDEERGWRKTETGGLRAWDTGWETIGGDGSKPGLVKKGKHKS